MANFEELSKMVESGKSKIVKELVPAMIEEGISVKDILEKKINEQGFDCKRATKEDIKRFISRYFGHVCEYSLDDVDGERLIKKWIIPD